MSETSTAARACIDDRKGERLSWTGEVPKCQRKNLPKAARLICSVMIFLDLAQ